MYHKSEVKQPRIASPLDLSLSLATTRPGLRVILVRWFLCSAVQWTLDPGLDWDFDTYCAAPSSFLGLAVMTYLEQQGPP